MSALVLVHLTEFDTDAILVVVIVVCFYVCISKTYLESLISAHSHF